MPTGKSALSIIQKYHPSVTRVIDAKKDVVIQVSKEDCKSGNAKAPEACAMANAFKRRHDGAIISLDVAYIVDGTMAIRYKVPASVSREIISFDRNGGFAPGEYKLNAPSESNALGHRNHPQPVNKKSGYATNKKRHHKTAGIRSL